MTKNFSHREPYFWNLTEIHDTNGEQEEVTIPVTDNLDDVPSLTQALKNLDPKDDSKDSANVSLAEYLSNKKVLSVIQRTQSH